MQRKKLSTKQLSWINWTPKDIAALPAYVLEKKQRDFTRIKNIPKDKRTFENTIWAYEHAGEAAEQLLAYCNLLFLVSTKKSVRQAAFSAINTYHEQILSYLYDPELYAAICQYQPKKTTLRPEDRRVYEKIHRGYHHLGFHLPEEKRTTFQNNLAEIMRLQSAFEQNRNEYNGELLLTKEETDGLPQWFVAGLSKKQGRYVVTNAYDHAGIVLTYARLARVRQKYKGVIEQAGGTENLKILKKLVKLRAENAHLLGYQAYADQVLEEQMAKDVPTVKQFLGRLEQALRPVMKRDVLALEQEKAKEKGGSKKEKMYDYDVSYYGNKLKERTYGISSETIQQYFPLPHVFSQMFAHFGALLGVRFVKKDNLPQWHSDVLLYEVQDKRTKKCLGYISFDLYPRAGKFNHMGALYVQTGEKVRYQKSDTKYHTPWSVIIGNFSRPTRSRPALLSHGEVVTLFHEFGHAMHNVLGAPIHSMLTSTPDDYSEMPSQLFENWAWEPRMLRELSAHYRTGEPLDDETIAQLVASRTHLIGFSRYRQILLSQFDLAIHTEVPAGSLRTAFKREVQEQVPIVYRSASYMPARWLHLGDHASQFYSYFWAEVLAHAVYERFAEAGITNAKLGMQLRKQLFVPRWEIPGETQLRNFLGKAPSEKAFIRSLTQTDR